MFVAELDEPYVCVGRRDRCAGEPGRPDERLRAREHGVFEFAGVGGHGDLLPALLKIRHDVIVERPEAPPPGMSRTRAAGLRGQVTAT